MTSRFSRLSKKDRKQRRAQIRLDRQTKKCVAHQCGHKIQHGDFLIAMQHADHLSRKTGTLYFVYHCDDCGFAHVGHTEASLVWMMGGWSEIVTR